MQKFVRLSGSAHDDDLHTNNSAAKNAPQLAITRRTRSTPFSSRVEDFGVQAYTIYNHMLLPTRIRGVEEDYFHLRSKVQLWDVSCQRQVELRGPDAARLAQLMTVRDLRKLEIGRCALAPVCDQDGFCLTTQLQFELLKIDFGFRFQT